MRYTIITPTLLRPSLARLCATVDAQTCTDWQHIVAVDEEWAPLRKSPLLPAITHTQREVVFCGRHRDWGNAPRSMAWEHAKGDYLLYIDDDNHLADERVLDTLRRVTDPVALFPLCYKGALNSPEPVAVGRSDGNGVMVERAIGRWPTAGGRSADGEFVVALTTKYRYQVLEERALVVYESEGNGAP